MAEKNGKKAAKKAKEQKSVEEQVAKVEEQLKKLEERKVRLERKKMLLTDPLGRKKLAYEKMQAKIAKLEEEIKAEGGQV